MSDILRCPFCGGILEQTSIYNLNSYACTDLNCKGYFMTATRSMWQELIRTRGALGIALDWLREVATPEKCDDDLCREFTKRKLIEIKKALEEKD